MISIDIETIPNLAMVDALPEPKAPGNLKDPAKIEKAIAEKKENQIADMALDPMYGRICSYAWFSDNGTNGCRVIEEISDAAEIVVVEEILDHLTIGDILAAPVIITWCGLTFDLPYIAKRAMILNVELPPNFPGINYFLKKYTTTPHCDLQRVYTMWETGQHLSLNQAAKIYLGECKDDIDFRTFPELIEKKDTDLLRLYNLKDADLTLQLYNKAKGYLF